jgi:hypothetical protein
MEIQLPVQAITQQDDRYIILKVTCEQDRHLVSNLFKKKEEWETRNKKEFFLQAHLELAYQKRTFKQNATVWVLVTAIFESLENRKPTEEERYGLYLDLLEVYAEKIPSRITGELRPVHISKSNSLQGARFIDNLLYHLATECDLEYGTQATVQSVLKQWIAWRGTLEFDPFDFADYECTRLLTEKQWRDRNPVSEASGRGGKLDLAHIVSRGSDTSGIEKSWNWVSLLHDEHTQQHALGWDKFLQIYPHLRGRIDRARELAGKLELEHGETDKDITDSEHLAMEALNENY